MSIEGQVPAKTLDQPTGDQPTTKLLQLHLEEYKALSHKSTALIGQMFTVMAIGFGYLGYLINNWQTSTLDHRPILWPGVLVEQIIIFFWLALRYSELGITVYIETELRMLCEPTLAFRGSFWRFRPFLGDDDVVFTKLSLWLPMSASLGAFVGVLIYRCGFMLGTVRWSKWDTVSTVVGSMLLIGTFVGSLKLKNLNRRFTNPRDAAVQVAAESEDEKTKVNVNP